MPSMALTEAQVVILYFFRIAIVSFNRVMSKNYSTNWSELRDEYFIRRNRGSNCHIIGVRNSEKLCDLC